jgi:hypothetical protein
VRAYSFHNTGVHSHRGDANSRVGFFVVVKKLLQQNYEFLGQAILQIALTVIRPNMVIKFHRSKLHRMYRNSVGLQKSQSDMCIVAMH